MDPQMLFFKLLRQNVFMANKNLRDKHLGHNLETPQMRTLAINY